MAVTGSEDVAFDVAAAETLESQCRSAACQVENLHSSRTGWVATAKTDFSGYFSTVFSDNADIETTDASNLAACLRGVADAVRFLIDPAGGRLDFSYDEAGRPTPTVGTDADGEVVLRSRESWRGRTLRAQGPDGADEIDVDRLGRPLAHRRDGRTVSTWAWSAGGELLGAHRPRGRADERRARRGRGHGSAWTARLSAG